MRFVDYAKNMPKPMLYDSYQRMCLAKKSYEKVTRTVMAENIIDNYMKDNGYLSSIITDKELNVIKKIFDGENKIENIDDYLRALKLQKKCIIYENEFNNKFYIYDEFVELLKDLIANRPKRHDDFLYLALGILKAVGNIPYDVYFNMISDLADDRDKNKIEPFLNHQAVFVFETYLYYEPKIKAKMIGYYDYIYVKDIIDRARKNKAMGGTTPINIDLLKDLYTDALPHCLVETQQLYNAFDDKKMLYFCALAINNHLKLADIEGMERFANDFDDNIKNIIMNLFKKIPSPALNGRTYEQWLETKKEIKEINKSFKNEMQTSKSLLKPYQLQRFYDVQLSLIAYTNKCHKVVKKDLATLISDSYFDIKKLDKYYFKVDEYIWKNPKVIDEYLRDNPYNMTQKDLALIRSFKKFKTGVMVICGYHSDGTEIFNLKDQKFYFVKGLNSKIVEVVGGCKLPLLVEMTLVPYEDVITYTGNIHKINVDSGSDLYKIIDDAKKQSKLIKRL